MKNQAIVGWRVRNRIACGSHVPDESPDGYRSITIPVDAVGTLTGDIAAYFEGIDEKACQLFMMDAERIRQALTKDILPNQRGAVENYWQQTKNLMGEDLLASRTALTVKWDDIYEQEPETINSASYIPWLEFMEKTDMVPADN